MAHFELPPRGAGHSRRAGGTAAHRTGGTGSSYPRPGDEAPALGSAARSTSPRRSGLEASRSATYRHLRPHGLVGAPAPSGAGAQGQFGRRARAALRRRPRHVDGRELGYPSCSRPLLRHSPGARRTCSPLSPQSGNTVTMPFRALTPSEKPTMRGRTPLTEWHARRPWPRACATHCFQRWWT